MKKMISIESQSLINTYWTAFLKGMDTGDFADADKIVSNNEKLQKKIEQWNKNLTVVDQITSKENLVWQPSSKVFRLKVLTDDYEGFNKEEVNRYMKMFKRYKAIKIKLGERGHLLLLDLLVR